MCKYLRAYYNNSITLVFMIKENKNPLIKVYHFIKINFICSSFMWQVEGSKTNLIIFFVYWMVPRFGDRNALLINHEGPYRLNQISDIVGFIMSKPFLVP